MNVLFQFVALPNLTSETNLFCSLVNEFVKAGHNVKVATKGDAKKETSICRENGIDVLRVKCDDFTGVASKIKKAIAYVKYSYLIVKYVKKFWKKEKFDLIITHSLPPELGYIVKNIKRHYKCPIYLLVTDFTWQDAVAYGFFKKNGPIGLYYRFWERVLFKNVDFIGVPTPGNMEYLKQQCRWLKDNQFSVFPFWQKPVELHIDNSIRNKYGLGTKFVAIYGGSVGPAQKLEHLVALAYSVRDNEDILFLVLGKGSNLDEIKYMVKEKGLSNVLFLDFLPQSEYLQLLSSCNAGMIILNEKHATPNFPSKACSYFNLMVPILASIDYVTDFGLFLESTNTGLWSYSGDNDTFKSNLLRLYEDNELRETIRNNEIDYFNSNMHPRHAYNAIMEQLYNDKKYSSHKS